MDPAAGASPARRATLPVLVTAVIIVLLVLLVALLAERGRQGGLFAGKAAGRFCSGPYNMQLYDSPFFYPHYEARALMQWDPDSRCSAYCGQTPCTVWCR